MTLLSFAVKIEEQRKRELEERRKEQVILVFKNPDKTFTIILQTEEET